MRRLLIVEMTLLVLRGLTKIINIWKSHECLYKILIFNSELLDIIRAVTGLEPEEVDKVAQICKHTFFNLKGH